MLLFYSFTVHDTFYFACSYSIYLTKLLGVNVRTSVSVLLHILNDQTARKQLYRIFCWR